MKIKDYDIFPVSASHYINFLPGNRNISYIILNNMKGEQNHWEFG